MGASSPMEKREVFREIKAGKAFRGVVRRYVAQGRPQPNAEIAEKIRLSTDC